MKAVARPIGFGGAGTQVRAAGTVLLVSVIAICWPRR